MAWKIQLAQMIRDQLPYCFPLSNHNKRQHINEPEFEVALGYVCEFVEMQRKACFMEGYARGMAEAISSKLGERDVECSKHHAEKSWMEFEK